MLAHFAAQSFYTSHAADAEQATVLCVIHRLPHSFPGVLNHESEWVASRFRTEAPSSCARGYHCGWRSVTQQDLAGTHGCARLGFRHGAAVPFNEWAVHWWIMAWWIIAVSATALALALALALARACMRSWSEPNGTRQSLPYSALLGLKLWLLDGFQHAPD
jgi:hypothetical protein